MRVEEVFAEDGKALEESFAIAKLRKEAKKRSKTGKRPAITVLQNPENKSNYILVVNESGRTYKTEMTNGKFEKTVNMSQANAAAAITQYQLTGWRKVDSRGWVEKYRIPIFFGAVGAATGIGLSIAGVVPVTAVLMPLISTFFALFVNLFADTLKNPLKTLMVD